MLIIENHQHLVKQMLESEFNLEEFFPDVKSVKVEQFFHYPLETRTDVALIDVISFITIPIDDRLLSLLNTFVGVICFVPSPVQKEAQIWLDKLMTLSDKVLSIQVLPQTSQEKLILKNQLLFIWRIQKEKKHFKEQMIRLSQDMDQIIQSAQVEMLKAKKIHDDVIPKRVEDIKGLTVYSKYAAGEGAGSEYFDVIRGQNQVHVIINHTDSYLASSCIMGLLNKYKTDVRKTAFDIEIFLQEVDREIQMINQHKKKPIKVNLFLASFDHSNLTFEGYSYGNFELISQMNGPIAINSAEQVNVKGMSQAKFKVKFQRGERVLFFSPGFLFNWKENNPTLSLEQFLKENEKLDHADLLMEYFFKLKKTNQKEFLSKDGTCLLLEVNKNVIHQV